MREETASEHLRSLKRLLVVCFLLGPLLAAPHLGDSVSVGSETADKTYTIIRIK
jgi:hypothetical protein